MVHLVLWMVAQNWEAAQPGEKSTERDTLVEGLFLCGKSKHKYITWYILGRHVFICIYINDILILSVTVYIYLKLILVYAVLSYTSLCHSGSIPNFRKSTLRRMKVWWSNKVELKKKKRVDSSVSPRKWYSTAQSHEHTTPCVQNPHEAFIDPTKKTGTYLLRMYLQHLGCLRSDLRMSQVIVHELVSTRLNFQVWSFQEISNRTHWKDH